MSIFPTMYGIFGQVKMRGTDNTHEFGSRRVRRDLPWISHFTQNNFSNSLFNIKACVRNVIYKYHMQEFDQVLVIMAKHVWTHDYCPHQTSTRRAVAVYCIINNIFYDMLLTDNNTFAVYNLRHVNSTVSYVEFILLTNKSILIIGMRNS